MEVREDDESFKMPLTFSLTLWNRRDPDHFALRQYKNINSLPEKQPSRSLFPVLPDWLLLTLKKSGEITMYDELDLDMLGDERTALFLIMGDTDGTFAFLISPDLFHFV